MKLFQRLDDFPEELRGGAVSIGNFDGVHRGHARIVDRLLSQSRRADGPSVVFTFEPHPVRLLRPGQAPPPLTWLERKGELLAALGVDAVLAYPTDAELLELTPEEFFDTIVCGMLSARALIEGPNFRFGHDRRGDVELLRRLCRKNGIQLEIVDPLRMEDDYISSSRIRDCIARGEIGLAHQMLGHPYRLRGLVTHGDKRGGKIGFPTANLEGIDTLLPPEGVYAGRAWNGNTSYPAAVHIGPIPTFAKEHPKVEVHLVDFDGSLYGQVLEVDFFERLRDIHMFTSVEALVAQLRRDVEKTVEVFGVRS